MAASFFMRRDLLVAVTLSFLAGAGLSLAATAGKPVMHSSIFNWADLKVIPTKVGEKRSVFDNPTLTLANLECHISTLNPGEFAHPPHRHPDEELTSSRKARWRLFRWTIRTSSTRAASFLRPPMNCTTCRTWARRPPLTTFFASRPGIWSRPNSHRLAQSPMVMSMSEEKYSRRPQFGQAATSWADLQVTSDWAGSFMWQPPQTPWLMPTTTLSPLFLSKRS